MPAHEGEEASVFSAGRIDRLPNLEKVVVHKANDVKTVGHDLGVREIFSANATIGLR